MNLTGRHASTPGADPTRRLGVTAALAAVLILTAIIGAVLAVRPGAPWGAVAAGAASAPATSPAPAPSGTPASSAGASSSRAYSGPAAAVQEAPQAPAAAAVSLVLTAADHRKCPAAATACVNLATHITWLQSGGRVTFGPVRMEPGKPGGGHETPRGTFHVSWKAGPAFVSSIYHEAMPWATFFAAGGIAFHGGSLTEWSHGCVHLTVANAHYYSKNLPVGAEVIVF
ncbi:MAG TPA: L,D-transpeptidase [Streptosporangiaceae bacterium]